MVGVYPTHSAIEWINEDRGPFMDLDRTEYARLEETVIILSQSQTCKAVLMYILNRSSVTNTHLLVVTALSMKCLVYRSQDQEPPADQHLALTLA